jgi:DNA replication protein DnaC
MNRHTELTSLLRGLKLQVMAERVSDVALKAARANLSHEAFLYELVLEEQEQRTQRRVERLRRESGLPREKTFATLELAGFSPLIRQQVERLRRGEFVKEAVNVVAVGPPGVGKSHLLASLGEVLVAQGVPVLWSSTAQLMQRLLAAKRDLRLPQELARLDRYACLILDDIGYVQHDQDEMEVLFTLLSERYERRSVMLSTNLVFSEWTRIFKHPLTTVAAIDRVVHHSVILDLMGMASFRAQAARAAQQAGAKAEEGAAASAEEEAGDWLETVHAPSV